MCICCVVLSSDSSFETFLLDCSEDGTGEGDAMDLFTPTSVGSDLQQTICIFKFVKPFTFSLQIGQANQSKEKSIIKEKIIFHFLFKRIKSYVDYASFEDIIEYHTITVTSNPKCRQKVVKMFSFLQDVQNSHENVHENILTNFEK